jgi:quercetin dioxygenase-like cupin family protein
MNIRDWLGRVGWMLLLAAGLLAAAPTEKVRNEKVRVVEQTLAPGETVSLPADVANAVIYLDAGSVVVTPARGTPGTQTVKRGDAIFDPSLSGTVKNAGAAVLRIVRIEYLGKGSPETWGTTGLSPNYKLLHEDQFSRVYDIKIAAGTSEPKHTHHDRIVVCLSGAQLEHLLSDGRKETSTLKTDEIVWRRGGTHVGHNLGKTDLWVIAIEPK